MRNQRTESRYEKVQVGRNALLLFLSLFSIICLIPSCKDEVEDYQALYEYEYYPLDSGRYIIYDVDSIKYRYIETSSNGGYTQYSDTIRYQLKEYYAGTFYDSFQGNLKYRIEYYRRTNQDEPWQNDRVWYVLKTSTSLQRQEDDMRFLKLVFPPREGYTWDGTSLIPKTGVYDYLVDWKFKYLDVGKPLTVNGKDFEKTLTVTHINTEEGQGNLVEYQYSKEVYAKGIGIIYKDWDKLKKQITSSSWENPQRAEGHRLRMRVNSYYP